MKTELEYIRKKYLTPTMRYWYNNKKDSELLLKILKYATPFERPDFYYLENNTCYICEHFEFDASKNTQTKGSSLKRSANIAEIKLNKKTEQSLKNIKHSDSSITNCGTFTETIECTQNKQHWKNNFLKHFENHYKNLEEYKNNLIQNNIINVQTKIKNIFIIEDTTEFGAFIKNAKSVCFPISFNFGIETIKNAKNIDYIIFLNSSQNDIILTNRNSFKNMKTLFEFEKTDIFFFSNITIIKSMIAIPDKLIKSN